MARLNKTAYILYWEWWAEPGKLHTEGRWLGTRGVLVQHMGAGCIHTAGDVFTLACLC